jgi:hypothetical protein
MVNPQFCELLTAYSFDPTFSNYCKRILEIPKRDGYSSLKSITAQLHSDALKNINFEDIDSILALMPKHKIQARDFAITAINTLFTKKLIDQKDLSALLQKVSTAEPENVISYLTAERSYLLNRSPLYFEMKNIYRKARWTLLIPMYIREKESSFLMSYSDH